MRIGLVVDSACDLPLAFLREHDIEIVPIALRLGEERYLDLRDPAATIEFYERLVIRSGKKIETEPFSVAGIRDLFLERLVTRFDRVLLVAISSARSKTFENATRASFAILKGYRERRRAAGLEGTFAVRIVDSGQLFSGEAVLVWDLVRRMREEPELTFEALRRHAEKFKRKIYAYAVPRDLFYLRERASARGDQSVGWLQFALGSLIDTKPIVESHNGETRPIAKVRHFETAVNRVMDQARIRIEKRRLASPVVVISYAGDPQELRGFSSYRPLRLRAQDEGVALLESPMSTTAGIYLGPGALSLGYAAQN